MSPGLFQDFMDGYIRLSLVAVVNSVVVMTVGSQSFLWYIAVSDFRPMEIIKT